MKAQIASEVGLWLNYYKLIVILLSGRQRFIPSRVFPSNLC